MFRRVEFMIDAELWQWLQTIAQHRVWGDTPEAVIKAFVLSGVRQAAGPVDLGRLLTTRHDEKGGGSG